MLRGRQAFEEWLLSINPADAGFIITFGPPYGLGKFQTAQYLESLGLEPITLISPHAIVDETAQIAPGAQILRGAIVQCYANIERHVIVNTGAVVEHDSHIGACTFLGPRSVICGRVHVGCHSTIGANATVITDMSVGDNTIVGAGAVVVKETPSNVVVAGVPARYLRANSIEKPSAPMLQDSEINAVKNL
jgi:sugar O-acyltransferase (sialic acid O-acetyltransferase NeuD family)